MKGALVIKEDHVHGLFMLLAKLQILKVQAVIDARPIKFRFGPEDMVMNSFKIAWMNGDERDK